MSTGPATIVPPSGTGYIPADVIESPRADNETAAEAAIKDFTTATDRAGISAEPLMLNASLTGAALTVELAQDVLKNILVVRGDKPDVPTIIKVVAEAMQVKPQDILGDRRQQNIARARQVAMYLTRRITALSYPVIGEKFGGKDHSTVINAEQRIEQLMGEEPHLAKTVESLLRRLNS